MANTEQLRAWVHAHAAIVDGLAVVFVLTAFEMPAFDPYRHAGGPWWPWWGLVVAAPLLWRHRFPIPVLVVSLAGTVGALVTRIGPDWGGLSLVALLLGPSVALANAAAELPTSVSRRLAVVCAAAIVATSVRLTPDVVAAQLAFVAAAWLAGEGIRARRHEITLLKDRAARQAEEAADDERDRIARELHDAVAHQLTVIAVQSGAARLAAGEHSADTTSLVTIEEASRQALGDLRRALGVLRGRDLDGGVAPQPRLDQLERLARRLRAAGLPLELTLSGDTAGVPDGIAVSVYRIVQEALTNVLNHAGPVATCAHIICSPVEIQLRVRNDRPLTPRSPSPGGGGHGLIGMRERVGAYRGSLQAGALPSGGFEVMARIPLP